MKSVKVDDFAPDFVLKNQDGVAVSLSDFRNKKNVILYFYPRASTPGCTVQGCGIRDAQNEFAKQDTVVLGISPDSPPKLQKFFNTYEFNFDLLADEDHLVAEAYGVWGPKKFMGKEFDGIHRTTFVINKAGRLKYVMDKVNTKTHSQEIIKILYDVI